MMADAAGPGAMQECVSILVCHSVAVASCRSAATAHACPNKQLSLHIPLVQEWLLYWLHNALPYWLQILPATYW